MENRNVTYGPWNGVEFWKSYKENKEHGVGDEGIQAGGQGERRVGERGAVHTAAGCPGEASCERSSTANSN